MFINLSKIIAILLVILIIAAIAVQVRDTPTWTASSVLLLCILAVWALAIFLDVVFYRGYEFTVGKMDLVIKVT